MEDKKPTQAEEILAAMRDFFSYWSGPEFTTDIPWPVSRGLMGGINEDGTASFDGSFDALDMAQHVADALNGTPRASAERLRQELLEAQAHEDSLTRYQKRWERDGVWMMGQGLLADIVIWLKGKHLVLADGGDPSTINVTLPLPTVLDEISKTRVSVLNLVPPELRERFVDCCERAISSRKYEVERQLKHLLFQARTRAVEAQISAVLSDMERDRAARGETELWQDVAYEFGFEWYALPKPAGMAA